MTMIGMNLAEMRRVPVKLRNAGKALSETHRQIQGTIQTMEWRGQDRDGFNQQWNTNFGPHLKRAVADLENMANILVRQIAEQEQTSATLESGGGGPGLPSPLNIVLDGLRGAWNLANDGIDWLHDRAVDGLNWTQDRLTDGAEAVQRAWNTTVDGAESALRWLGDRANDMRNAAGQAWDRVVHTAEVTWPAVERFIDANLTQVSLLAQLALSPFTGDPPTPGQLAASTLLVVGTGAGIPANFVSGVTGGEDLHIFAQGSPTASDPRPVPVNPPTDINGLTNLTMRAYDHGGVLITEVPDPSGGPSRYIVSISGTQPELGSAEGWTGHESGLDWPANVHVMAKGESAATQAVQMAMQNAGVPEGAEVLITGHSQGGLVGTNLAADPAFNSRYSVEGVVTYGSPVDAAGVPSDIPVLSFENKGDVVPILDMNIDDQTSNINRVPFGPWKGPADAHIQSSYVESVNSWAQNQAAVDQATDPLGLDRFLNEDGNVQGVEIGMTR